MLKKYVLQNNNIEKLLTNWGPWVGEWNNFQQLSDDYVFTLFRIESGYA